MLTVILIVLGLALAAVFIAAGRVADRRSSLPVNGAFIFVVCWTAFTLGDFLARIFQPAEGPLVDLGKHVAVFLVPIAAALIVNRRAGAPARSAAAERRRH